MKVTKKVFIYIDSKGEDPMVLTSQEIAENLIKEDIEYDAQRYHLTDEEIADCYEELSDFPLDGDYRGTYILDHHFGYYIREVEFEV